jgi:hypothetical protein
VIQKIKRKFALWRGEPEHVRLRIATYLTGATGGVVVLLWLFVLLPLQLALTGPSEGDAVTEELGEVAGLVASATPTPTPSTSPNGY